MTRLIMFSSLLICTAEFDTFFSKTLGFSTVFLAFLENFASETPLQNGLMISGLGGRENGLKFKNV